MASIRILSQLLLCVLAVFYMDPYYNMQYRIVVASSLGALRLLTEIVNCAESLPYFGRGAKEFLERMAVSVVSFLGFLFLTCVVAGFFVSWWMRGVVFLFAYYHLMTCIWIIRGLRSHRRQLMRPEEN